MGLIGLLVGLAVLAVPVALVALIVFTTRLARRVAALEAALAPAAAGREAAAAAPGAPQTAPAAEPAAPPAQREPTVVEPAPPESAPTPPAEAVRPPPPRPQGPSRVARLVAWLRENWFYALSAVSLGLAGIFLVQYGIETGLLTPTMRVLLALALGFALIGAGEYIRRRWGDEEDTSTAFLPSTFSGAGIVVLYAAVLAARALYGLIGPEIAFAGLVAVSGIALVFGWFYGPLLAAAGLTGAAAAPFLTGGEADSGTLFYIYYGLLGTTGLAIDAMRRWGWVSALALALAYGAASLVRSGGGEIEGYAALLTWLALAAVALPRLERWPSHPGPTVTESVLALQGAGTPRAIPPSWIAAAAVLASCGLLYLTSWGDGPEGALLSLFALTFLLVALTLWAAGARGLADLAVVPAAVVLLRLVEEAWSFGPLFSEVYRYDPAAHPEEAPPLLVTTLVGLATAGSVAFFRRSFRGPWPALWAAAAAVFAPSAAVILELFWQPARAIGAYLWAGHAIALAALMTLFAARFSAADGEDRRRAAYAALSALSLIALSLFILLAEAALTVALSVLVAVAAGLDRRFRLPEMHWFLVAGVATLGWRLLVDPGLPDYLEHAPLWEVALAYGAALAGLGVGLLLLPAATRAPSRALLESAIWAYGGAFVSVLLWRAIIELTPASALEPFSHWAAGILGMTWTALALAQAYRLRHDPTLRALRTAIAAVYGTGAALAFLLALTLLNPAAGLVTDIYGYQPFDTLAVAYALPALLCATIAARARWLPGRQVFAWLAGLLAAVWVFLEIRWFWQGDAIAWGAFSQPELYSYTVALLVAGGGLLCQAIARRSRALRRLAIVVIALTVAKVFLIDASGLTGLLRVFSFLALGLVLAALAWLNRWAAGQAGRAA